jgi:hypothetical protein
MNMSVNFGHWQESYDVEIPPGGIFSGSTGPQITPLPEYWPGTSSQIVVVRSEQPQGVEDLAESERADMTGDELRRPEELCAAIDLALQQEMIGQARELAQLGAQLFPGHGRVQRAAQVLAPPDAQAVRLPPAQGLKRSRRWVRENASEYRGQWVAVRSGRLLGVGASLEEVRAVIEPDEDPVEILVTRVL